MRWEADEKLVRYSGTSFLVNIATAQPEAIGACGAQKEVVRCILGLLGKCIDGDRVLGVLLCRVRAFAFLPASRTRGSLTSPLLTTKTTNKKHTHTQGAKKKQGYGTTAMAKFGWTQIKSFFPGPRSTCTLNIHFRNMPLLGNTG